MADNRDYMDDKLYEAARLQGADIPSVFYDDVNAFLCLTPDKSNVLHIAAGCSNQGFILAVLDRVPAIVLGELLCNPNSEGETPLHLAAQAGHKGVVETLLFAHHKYVAAPLNSQKKPCWSERDKNGDTPLHTALRYGHDGVALLLLEKDMQLLVSIDNEVGESATYLAVANSCTGFLNRVLEADHNGQCHATFSGSFGQTAFHSARKLTGDVMSKLIEARKNLLKVQDKRGKTVLHYVVEEKRTSIIRTILQADNSLAYLRDEDGLTPLHKAASMGSTLMIQTIMELSPQSIRVRDKCHGRTALHLAKMDACFLEECLKKTRMKELINLVDNDGNTPLHLALIEPNILVANKLLDVDDINWRLINKEGNRPMDLGSFDDHITYRLKSLSSSCRLNMEIFFNKNVLSVDDLLDHYSWEQCLTYQGPKGDNILHVATRDGYMKIINKVNESNSALRSLILKQNFEGETPLHLAAQYGRLEVVKFILSVCTPSDICGNCDNPSNIIALENGDGNQLTNSMPWRMQSANGDTPAHTAIRNRFSTIALLLLERDPELISFTNNMNESLLYLAGDNHCMNVVKHILSKDIEFDDSITSGRDGQNFLHVVIGFGLCKNLVMQKPKLLKEVDVNGKTPLHYASEYNMACTTWWLLKQDKTAAFVYDNEGFTPLMRAASLGCSNCIKTILNLCPQSAELRDLRNGRTVLHLAQMSGFLLNRCMRNQTLVRLVNETDKDGNTALHRAILDGEVDKALVLLQTKGLNWRIKNKMNKTPYDLCTELRRSGKTEQRPVHVGLFGVAYGEDLMPRAPWLISCVVKKFLLGYANLIMTEENAKKLVGNIAVAAGLLLTITSTASFTIPGGYNQTTGDAMRMNQASIKVFMGSDVVAMLMCISILVRYTLGVGGRGDKLRKLAVDSIIMLQISLLATVVAFISAAYAIGLHFKSVITIPVTVVVLLNLVILVRPDFFEFMF